MSGGSDARMKYWMIDDPKELCHLSGDIISLPAKIHRLSRQPELDRFGNQIPKFPIAKEIRVGDNILYCGPIPHQMTLWMIGLIEIFEGPSIFVEGQSAAIQFRIKF